MNRTKGILAAGTLTGLVLVTLLALGFRNVDGQGQAATAVPEIIVQPVMSPAAESSQVDNTDQSYTQQLEAALTTLQAREAAYRTQLDAANQTIVQLQDQINSDRAAQAVSAPANNSLNTFGEHEEHEGSGVFEGFEHDDD